MAKRTPVNVRGFATAPALWALAITGVIVFSLAAALVAEERRQQRRALLNEALLILNAVRVHQTEEAELATTPVDADEAGWPDPDGPDNDLSTAADNCAGALGALEAQSRLSNYYNGASGAHPAQADTRVEWSAACGTDTFTLELQCRDFATLAGRPDACPEADDLRLVAVRSGGVYDATANDITWMLHRSAEYPAIRIALERALHQTVGRNHVRGHGDIDPFAALPVRGAGYPTRAFPPPPGENEDDNDNWVLDAGEDDDSDGILDSPDPCPAGGNEELRAGVSLMSMTFEGFNQAADGTLSFTGTADSESLMPHAWSVTNDLVTNSGVNHPRPHIRINVMTVLGAFDLAPVDHDSDPLTPAQGRRCIPAIVHGEIDTNPTGRTGPEFSWLPRNSTGGGSVIRSCSNIVTGATVTIPAQNLPRIPAAQYRTHGGQPAVRLSAFSYCR